MNMRMPPEPRNVSWERSTIARLPDGTSCAVSRVSISSTPGVSSRPSSETLTTPSPASARLNFMVMTPAASTRHRLSVLGRKSEVAWYVPRYEARNWLNLLPAEHDESDVIGLRCPAGKRRDAVTDALDEGCGRAYFVCLNLGHEALLAVGLMIRVEGLRYAVGIEHHLVARLQLYYMIRKLDSRLC